MKHVFTTVAYSLAAIAGLVLGYHSMAKDTDSAEITAKSLSEASPTAEQQISASSAAKAIAFSFSWPAGVRYSYDFTYTGTSDLKLFPDNPDVAGRSTFNATLALAGKLMLTSHGLVEGHNLVVVELGNLQQHDVTAMGQALIPDRSVAISQLQGHKAYLSIDTTGRQSDLRFTADAPPIFHQLIESLLREGEVIVASGQSTWDLRQTSNNGDGIASYRVTSADVDSIDLVRVRDHYDALKTVPSSISGGRQQLDSRYEITLNRNGYLEQQSGREQLIVLDTRGETAAKIVVSYSQSLAEITNVDIAQLEARQLATLVTREATHAAGRERARRASLEKQIDGMTIKAMRSDLLDLGAGGGMPDHDNWLLRVTALLELYPDKAHELVRIYSTPELGDAGHEMIMDILANVGHSKAQAAMRKILASEQVRSDPNYGRLVQSMLLMQRPDTDTADFLVETYGTLSDDGRRLAVANTLGAIAGQLQEAGQTADAERYGMLIAGELDGSLPSQTTRALLRALGNAGVNVTEPSILDFAQDQDSGNRAAAARALRNIRTETSRSALVEMLDDKDSYVQRQAIDSLAEHGFKSSDLERIETLIDQDIVHDTNLGALARSLAHVEQPSPAAIATLRAAVGGNIRSPQLRRYIHSVLLKLEQKV